MSEPPSLAGDLVLYLPSRRATQRLGRLLARALGPGDLLVLEGSLGAGKTFLVQAIVHALGVPASQPVTSPTFEIIHEFQGRFPIVHADLYRLDPSETLEELGLASRIGNDALVLIEWGERFASQLGDSGLRATLQLQAGSARSCGLRARSPSAEALLGRVAAVLEAAGFSRV